MHLISTAEKPHPDKPGVHPYEQVLCLIVRNGEPLLRQWNCEHQVWDTEDGDDFFCHASEVSHWVPVSEILATAAAPAPDEHATPTVSPCACLGPMYGEPHCFCEMQRKGLPLNTAARAAEDARSAAQLAQVDWGALRPPASTMTALQKLKWAILVRAAQLMDMPPPAYPCANADELYEALVIAELHWDAKNEVRSSGVDTQLPHEWSRNYDSKAVAMAFPDGSWVGWTYWYGGGKHGDPDALAWMDTAYDVQCHERLEQVTVREFRLP